MLIQDYNLEKIKSHPIYYILQNFSNQDTDINFIIKTPDEEINFEDCELFRLSNGKILICFKNSFAKYFSSYSIEASNGVTKEIVTLQIFERIKEICNKPITNENGAFIFCKSVKVEEGSLLWRCDQSLYGPRAHAENNTFREAAFKSPEDVIIYEPILSVNSVAHITYGWAKDDEETAEYIINNDPVPSSARTLSEIFKLIYEWAIVSEEPFNNQDNISTDAKIFLDSLNFDPALISNQVDMQISNFLSGNTDARKRPQNIQENSPELLEYVKKKTCHFTLSDVFSLFPESCSQEDFDEIFNFEKSEVNRYQKSLIEQTQAELEYFDHSNKNIIINKINEIQNPISNGTLMLINKLASQKEILDELSESI